MEQIHHVYQALRATHAVQERRDYVVKDRRSDHRREIYRAADAGAALVGRLHQSGGSQRRREIERENQTLAPSPPKLFPHDKSCRMTGTAETEAAEFREDLQPGRGGNPDEPLADPQGTPDVVYRTEKEKFEAVVTGSCRKQFAGQRIRHVSRAWAAGPGGTISIGSRAIADIRRRPVCPHQVLNAKQHEPRIAHRGAGGTQRRRDCGDEQAGRGRTYCWAAIRAMTREHFPKNKLAIPYAAAPAVIGADSANGDAPAAAAVANGSFSARRQDFPGPEGPVGPALPAVRGSVQNGARRSVTLGGLHIWAPSARSASHRQSTAGRAGRQGDPGSSRFFFVALKTI